MAEKDDEYITLKLLQQKNKPFLNFIRKIARRARNKTVSYKYIKDGKTYTATFGTTFRDNGFLKNIRLSFEGYYIHLYFRASDLYFLGFQVVGQAKGGFMGKVYELGFSTNKFIMGSTSLRIGEKYGDLGYGQVEVLGTVQVNRSTLQEAFRTLVSYSLNANQSELQPTDTEMKKALVKIVLMAEAIRFKDIRDIYHLGYNSDTGSQLIDKAELVHKWKTTSQDLRTSIKERVAFEGPRLHVIMLPKDISEDY